MTAYNDLVVKEILGINWQRNITNKGPNAETKCEPWSQMIRARILAWLGHLMRLNSETPSRKALEKHLRKVKRPRGRQKTTWIQTIRQDLKRIDIKKDLSKEKQTLSKLMELTQDRNEWREKVQNALCSLDCV